MKGNKMANSMAEMMDVAQSQGGEDQGNSGYEICIKVGGDGKISVGVESGEYEAAEDQGMQGMGESEESDMKPAANIRDAIQMAMDIYRNNGQMGSSDEEQSAFKAGFGKRGKSPMVDKYQEDESEMM